MKKVIFGLSYGDEGKARVVGYFAKQYDWTIRFNGGGNAGHTVYDDDGKMHKLHYLSAGALFGKKVCLDAGSVVNLRDLKKEIDILGKDIDLYISENVHMISDVHLDKDASGSNIGSTKKGIAYVYADRALRRGDRVTKAALDDHEVDAAIYRGLPPIAKSESAIFEGAQGIMLDIDYGDYPYVTSSSVMPSSAHRIDSFTGVMKAYVSRVGDGPPNHPDIEMLRAAGNEFGTTTGRPRKCTWLDVDDITYAISITQPDEIVVTKLDILEDMDINVYKSGELFNIGNLDNYKNFLLETFPQIKYFSESPKGDLIEV